MKVEQWKRDLWYQGKKDPVFWVKEVLGNTLWSKQADIARAVIDNERIAVPASFGVGKTFLAAQVALWFLYNFRPCRVITTAPTNRQVKDLLWAELRTAHNRAKYDLGGTPTSLQLHVDDDRFAVGFSTRDYNMDYFTGYHSENQLIIFDQASGLPKTFFDGAEGLMTSANCRWLAIGNTAIPDGEFANICVPGRKTKYGEWKIIPITAHETPNVIAGENIYPGLIAHDWIEKRRKAWGEDDPLYQIFVDAKFVASSQMAVLPVQFIDAAFERSGEMGSSLEIGVDVARTGADNSVWTVKSGTKGLFIKRRSGFDTMMVCGETVQLRRDMEERYGMEVEAIKIDTIGLGAGVYDRLLELDEPVVSVNNAESAAYKERYANVRAEMAWAFRTQLEAKTYGLKDIETEDDDEILDLLRGDMYVQKYRIASNGRRILWDKDLIKKELGRSPDYWDSLVMAFEYPGGGVPEVFSLVKDSDGEINFRKSQEKMQVITSGNGSGISVEDMQLLMSDTDEF